MSTNSTIPLLVSPKPRYPHTCLTINTSFPTQLTMERAIPQIVSDPSLTSDVSGESQQEIIQNIVPLIIPINIVPLHIHPHSVYSAPIVQVELIHTPSINQYIDINTNNQSLLPTTLLILINIISLFAFCVSIIILAVAHNATLCYDCMAMCLAVGSFWISYAIYKIFQWIISFRDDVDQLINRYSWRVKCACVCMAAQLYISPMIAIMLVITQTDIRYENISIIKGIFGVFTACVIIPIVYIFRIIICTERV